MGDDEAAQILKEIAWGERPIADVCQVGIDINKIGSKLMVTNPRRLSVTLAVDDLAKGLLKKNSDNLAEWASFILAASAFDLDVEDDPIGDRMLNTLWDCAFGDPPDEGIMELARQRLTQNS